MSYKDEYGTVKVQLEPEVETPEDDPTLHIQWGLVEIRLPFTILSRVGDDEGTYPPTIHMELDQWVGDTIAQRFKEVMGQELKVLIFGRDYT